ncbi:MAG: glycoside hydrolase family 20 zincin-like fold domain-containing protein, partial [Bacteroidales bacterium]|nr:glycoside hydrolase family 20 zincin-like fold domain-containing protein [Bacteroidales bacterium]
MKINTTGQIAGAAIILLIMTTFASCSKGGRQVEYEPLSLIPAPAVTEAAEGEFLLSSGTGLVIDHAFGSAGEIAGMFNGFLVKHYGKIRVTEQQAPGDENIIIVKYDSLIDNPEAYILEVSADGIEISAGDDAGLFYAFQTLKQLIFPSQKADKSAIAVPCVKISDSPQYRWRGMHLDVSRHFFPKEFIFKVLDAMA